LLYVLIGYSVRGGEPAVAGALPEGGLKRHPRCGVFGVAPNAPRPDEAPSRVLRNEDEARNQPI
jgi:hypothetical protein